MNRSLFWARPALSLSKWPGVGPQSWLLFIVFHFVRCVVSVIAFFASGHSGHFLVINCSTGFAEFAIFELPLSLGFCCFNVGLHSCALQGRCSFLQLLEAKATKTCHSHWRMHRTIARLRRPEKRRDPAARGKLMQDSTHEKHLRNIADRDVEGCG